MRRSEICRVRSGFAAANGLTDDRPEPRRIGLAWIAQIDFVVMAGKIIAGGRHNPVMQLGEQGCLFIIAADVKRLQAC
jgi:hypothetical protein